MWVVGARRKESLDRVASNAGEVPPLADVVCLGKAHKTLSFLVVEPNAERRLPKPPINVSTVTEFVGGFLTSRLGDVIQGLTQEKRVGHLLLVAVSTHGCIVDGFEADAQGSMHTVFHHA